MQIQAVMSSFRKRLEHELIITMDQIDGDCNLLVMNLADGLALNPVDYWLRICWGICWLRVSLDGLFLYMQD